MIIFQSHLRVTIGYRHLSGYLAKMPLRSERSQHKINKAHDSGPLLDNNSPRMPKREQLFSLVTKEKTRLTFFDCLFFRDDLIKNDDDD